MSVHPSLRIALSLLLAGAMASPALAQAPAAARRPAAAAPATPAIPDRAEVLAVLDRVAAAQIAALKVTDLDPNLQGRNVRGLTPNWVSATFLVGAARVARVSENRATAQYLRSVADRYNFALQGAGAPTALLNADNQAIGDLYQELYARSRQPGMLMPLKSRLDFTVPYLQKSPAPAKLVWWWCDALFMAPPVLSRMSLLTGDPKYIRAMDTQWWRTYDRLWDKEEHLFARDERFLTMRSANGKKIFWSRGNGWVMAGLARVLETMPADFPSRPRYEQLYREMSAKIITLQGADGLWRTSLLDTAAFPEPETSGTAFYTYALAFGINHGILDRATYQPHVLKGWAGLNRHILPNGLLGSVQKTGDQPVPTLPTDIGHYATGGFLLAGVEIMNLSQPVTPLPLVELEPAARRAGGQGGQAAQGIGADNDGPPEASSAPAANPAEAAENRRRTLERQAVRELQYNPVTDDPQYRSPVLAPFVGGGEQTVKIAPPTPEQRIPRATVRFAPDRYDDILWENDRTAHRIYGPTLEAREPPSGSGIDAWAKRVRWPFMDRQLKTGTYHNDQGEGMDYYSVKGTRGVGGLGVWQDNKLWVSRNWKTYKILKNGPDVAAFTVDYAPWPVGVDRKVWESRTFTLPLGTNFTRVVSVIHSDKPEPLIIGIGLGKGATVPGRGGLLADRAGGRLSFWEPTDPDHGAMGAAILVDPASVERIGADGDNNLILIRVTPGKPFVYYLGAAWDQGLDFKSREEWEAYVKAYVGNFDPAR